MKNFLRLIILTLLSSNLSLATSHLDQNLPKSLQEEHLQNFLAQPVGKMVGQLPNSYDQIIQNSVDLSADHLKQIAEASESHWKLESSIKDPILLMGKLELITLRDLNLSASEIWKSLVQCNDGDINLVRKQILNMKKFCVQGHLNGQVEKSFFELAQNFQTYLISIPLINVQSAPIYNTRSIHLVHIHPLLVQIAIATKAIFMNMTSEERTYLSEVIDMVSLRQGSVSLADYLRTNSPRNLLEKVQGATQMDHFAVYKLFVNSLGFLRFLAPAEKSIISTCEIYGLWPALNRSFLYRTNLHVGADTAAQQHMYELELRVFENCGHGFSHFPRKGSADEIYSSVGGKHLYASKKLFMYWLGRFW